MSLLKEIFGLREMAQPISNEEMYNDPELYAAGKQYTHKFSQPSHQAKFYRGEDGRIYALAPSGNKYVYGSLEGQPWKDWQPAETPGAQVPTMEQVFRVNENPNQQLDPQQLAVLAQALLQQASGSVGTTPATQQNQGVLDMLKQPSSPFSSRTGNM